MSSGKVVFSQVMEFLPLHIFRQCVDHHNGNNMVNEFTYLNQYLRIKASYGTSENAVKTHIWIAVSVYVLVAITKKQLNIQAILYTMLSALSVSAFERTLFFQLLAQPDYKVKN